MDRAVGQHQLDLELLGPGEVTAWAAMALRRASKVWSGTLKRTQIGGTCEMRVSRPLSPGLTSEPSECSARLVTPEIGAVTRV